jgi:thiamine pyrophosphokinase
MYEPNIASGRFAVIVAAGSTLDEDVFYRRFISDGAYSVAADAGLKVFHRLNILPDLFIGDGDSVGSAEWQWAQRHQVPAQKFPCDKDATDTQLALDFLLQRGDRDIYILGGIGSRLDHTLANLYLLTYAHERHARVTLYHPYHNVHLLTPEQPLTLHGDKGDLVSLLPVTDSITGVVAQGFRWNLTAATLYRGSTVGVSNYLVGEEASVSLATGLAFVMKVKE